MRTLTSYVATKTGRDIHLQSSYLPLPPSQSPLSSGEIPPLLPTTHHLPSAGLVGCLFVRRSTAL